ncbi:MAG: nucleoside deaminase [Candidatus Babeliales bacterium]
MFEQERWQESYMQLAIDKAKIGIANGQAPFGSCIVRDSQIIITEHNVVWATTDITAHAEIQAIRQACKILNSIDLSGCTIYSTTEPCPMCFTACHWANIDKIVFGTSIADAKQAGFSELTISNEQMQQLGGSNIEIIPDRMRNSCVELFTLWKDKNNKIY